MDPRALRRLFLWVFLGFLGCTALLAIGAVLSGSFGELQARVLASSASVSAASICAMACAAFRERGRVPGLGTAGIALAGVALAAVLVAVWTEHPGESQMRWTFTIVVYAVATAHAELLLLPRLSPRHAPMQLLAVGSIALLAVLLTVAILGHVDNEGMMRTVAVVAIVVALQTLAIPILWKIGGDEGVSGAAGGASAPQLVLRQGADGVWVDAAGARYVVRRLGT